MTSAFLVPGPAFIILSPVLLIPGVSKGCP